MNRSNVLAVARSEPVAWPGTARTAHRTRLGRLPGMAVRADLSCAFGVLLTAWTFASGFLPETDPGRGVVAYWTAGLVGALGVVGSLLVHELGHAVAARRAGLGIARITLSFAGGTSEIVGVVRYPRQELAIAAAGPIASGIAVMAAALTHVVIVEVAGGGLAATTAALVAVANLALVLLNIIPGLPLDGGRLLRASVWALTRRPDSATRVVLAIGRRLGETMIVVAILASAFGFVWIALWTAFLGVVLREHV